MGELGLLDGTLAMLARVLPLSRPVGVQLLKMETPNGELVPGTWANGLRWGKEPALSLERRVEAEPSACSMPGEGDLNGVCDGEGREVLEAKDGIFSMPLTPAPAGNLDGTVPARARRVWGKLSGVGSWAKSGKPSVGDSGMFSRRGVELPLVGGPPHGFTGNPEMPSWAWISRALRHKAGSAVLLQKHQGHY